MRLFVAIPAHSAHVHVGTLGSLVQSLSELGGAGISIDLRVWSGDSLLPHARNALVAEFLAGECEKMVFIDADVSWEPGALLKLVTHEEDIVAGLYRFKREPEGYPLNWTSAKELWANKHGLLEAECIPMGFTCLSRHACAVMRDSLKDRSYRYPSAPDLECYPMFSVEFVDGRGFVGEDFIFCSRWRDEGGQIWVDPELSLTHHGLKDFPGHLGNWLRSRMKDAA